jgi:hypothetical protein
MKVRNYSTRWRTIESLQSELSNYEQMPNAVKRELDNNDEVSLIVKYTMNNAEPDVGIFMPYAEIDSVKALGFEIVDLLSDNEFEALEDEIHERYEA